MEQLRKAPNCGFNLADRGLHLRDGGDHAGLALTEGNAYISLGKGVIYGLNDHSGHADAKRGVPDGDGIAELDPFQQSRIFRLFPQRLKRHRDRGNGRAQRICADIRIRLGSKLVLCDSRAALKFAGEIHDERFRPDDLRSDDRQCHLCQRDHRFGVRAILSVNGIWQQSRVDTAVVLVLLQSSEVFAVFNDHAGFLPAMGMELDREVVPFKLAVPLREHGAVCAAETGADTFRLCDRKCLCIRVVRPARESCISGKELQEDELRRLALGRKRQHRHIGKVIRNVLTVDGYDAV